MGEEVVVVAVTQEHQGIFSGAAQQKPRFPRGNGMGRFVGDASFETMEMKLLLGVYDTELGIQCVIDGFVYSKGVCPVDCGTTARCLSENTGKMPEVSARFFSAALVMAEVGRRRVSLPCLSRLRWSALGSHNRLGQGQSRPPLAPLPG